MIAALVARRLAAGRIIDENPADIVLLREEITPDTAGGGVITTRTLPAFRGRITPTTRQIMVSQDPSGRLNLSIWTLIAPWDADVRMGDAFQAQGRRFRIGSVVHRRIAGDICAIHAKLEDIS